MKGAHPRLLMNHFMALIAALFFSPALFAQTATTTHPDISINDNLKLVVQSNVAENRILNYSANEQYPMLQGRLDSITQDFNQQMHQYSDNQLQAFIKQVADNNASQTTALPHDVNQNHLNVDYNAIVMKPADKVLLSVRFKNEVMLAGQAHPTHTIMTFNFDLTTGTPVYLSDLFQLDSNYLQVIATYCANELRKTVINDDKTWFGEGTAATADNYQHWTLQPDGILFTFDEYQIASYDFGQPEVLVPYKALSSVMSPTAPIGAEIN